MQSIASGDGPVDVDRTSLERYYAATGTPPGRFLGRGLALLDEGRGVVAGSVVEDEHLRRMLKELADPITGKALSTRGLRSNAVGSFDLTFSPTKSISVAWALADAETRQRIYECQQAAVAEVLAYAEEHVFRVRAGKDGIVSDHTNGVIAAAFTHFDSRAGDPQLHDHVVVMNRAQSARDGQWRSLDSRAIFSSAVELSELHNGLLADKLTAQLGFGWDRQTRLHSDVPKWEIAGVPVDLAAAFSQRTDRIAAETTRLITQFEADHGRTPTQVEIIRLRQTATLSTRSAKHHSSLDDLLGGWRTRAGQVLNQTSQELDGFVPALVTWPALVNAAIFTPDTIATIAEEVLTTVSTKRSTFSASNLRAEAARRLQGVRFATGAERAEIMRAVGEQATSQAVLLNTPDLREVPALLARSSASEGFHDTAHLLYTSRLVLDAEGRLLEGSDRVGAPAIDPVVASTIAEAPLPGRSYTLSDDQRIAVLSVATSSREIDLLVGPAGSGKSTAMAGLKAIWDAVYGPDMVLGLAPSANAAQVLGEELSIDTENVAKFLHEYRRNGERQRARAKLDTEFNERRISGKPPTFRMIRARTKLADSEGKWQLAGGQLVIVDEASMLSTFDFDELASAVREAGAKLLCVGDYAQLTSVDAGGMFSTLVDSRADVATLDTLQRFHEPWEAAATLLIRGGHDTAFYAYQRHERLVEGAREDLMDQVYAAWKTDLAAGKTSLMMARDNQTVLELNARARIERLKSGEVVGDTRVAGGLAGVGDLVVTRHNDRSLSDTGHDWVRNGDMWRVTEIHADGALSLRRRDGDGAVRVPATYAQEYVELGYAATLHRAQGRTVDRAHCLVDPVTDRASLYVGITRGRESNMLYVDTAYDADSATSHDGVYEPVDLQSAFHSMLANARKDRSATEIIRDAAEQRNSVRTLINEYDTIVSLTDTTNWRDVLAQTLSAPLVETLATSDGYELLTSSMRRCRDLGHDLDDTLVEVIGERPLTDVRDAATVLDYRLRRWLDSAPEPESGRFIAGLFPAGESETPDIARALEERHAAIEERCDWLLERGFAQNEVWVHTVGTPPAGEAGLDWHDLAVTVAAYRDRWGITDSDVVLGEVPSHNSEQRVQRDRAQQALEALHQLREETSPMTVFSNALDEPGRDQSPGFGIEL
jgi:conjugative relaxase-like TrwC/TraI family protein